MDEERARTDRSDNKGFRKTPLVAQRLLEILATGNAPAFAGGTALLDFGCGRGMPVAKAAAFSGTCETVSAYDIQFDGGDVKAHGKGLFSVPYSVIRYLRHGYNIVTCSNVLNVQQDRDQQELLLRELASFVAPGGVILVNYPKAPRKGPEITFQEAIYIVSRVTRFDSYFDNANGVWEFHATR